jgi:hypothetical protein
MARKCIIRSGKLKDDAMDRLRAFEMFCAVVGRGGFARAADALDTSPANVTRYIAELEAHLGTRLLNRTSRRLSLTEAGDLPVQLPLAILPIVRVLTPKQQLEMEKTLLEMREQIDAKLGEQESIVKMSVRAGPTTAYAIFIVGLAVLQGA